MPDTRPARVLSTLPGAGGRRAAVPMQVEALGATPVGKGSGIGWVVQPTADRTRRWQPPHQFAGQLAADLSSR